MKDPALLMYYDVWLTATAEMDSDVRGWYLNLIIHQFDKKDLPDDLEKLAILAGVKFSEFDRFKQVFEQVFEQKFERNKTGRLENAVAREILRKRESFKEKRSNSGRLSYFLKYVIAHFSPDTELLSFIKTNVDLANIDLKNEASVKQVFEQISELYINGDIYCINNNKGVENFEQKKRPEKFKCKTCYDTKILPDSLPEQPCPDCNPYPFETFWTLYDKKIDRVKCEKKWDKLQDNEKKKCLEKLPDYVKSTPDKKFRRSPDVYLNNRSWENEIIQQKNNTHNAKSSEPDQLPDNYNPYEKFIGKGSLSAG